MEREELLGLRIVVLAGGWSSEREISLSSGRACQAALREAGVRSVDLLDPAEDEFIQKLMDGHYDVAFIAMHGRYGEDGCVQGLLEVLHIPYTFSGVAASAVGTEKELSVAVCAAAGIDVPQGIDVPATTVLSEDEVADLVARFGLPLFVKPSNNGSSYGVSRVTEASELNDAIALAGAQGSRVLIEECVVGTEVTVAVIGNADAKALPIVEIVTGADFYDTKVKYEPSELHHVIPARLPEDVYARTQAAGVAAHKALGCRGCSRSDFIVKADGTPVYLETNTIPGMTATSLLPDAARHDGIEFPDLCCLFVELALED